MDASVIKKLQFKSGTKAAVLNAPPGYVDESIPVSESLTGAAGQSLDFVQVFVRNAGDLARVIPEVQKALKHDGLLWISYPKGSSKVKTDLNRDILWKEMEQYHLLGVSLVSIDETWSAMRFRPADKVGSSP
ncbi:hypothetical protein Dform_01700 [Dehalogenimonas formicexedens]|uniref:DUF3052 domain-containing protein n=1 Tax=Dehalogenimonas formicexedens TaxID=1839801 RepID=A0A1P8F9A1_9CHLR|nr:hypothetical protein [Dehalogenimonas formicexedens]APV45020.1 hypothetical protein Dform_01700 [Dehalogenimonas formicexedens]